jgi:hypothetical protein
MNPGVLLRRAWRAILSAFAPSSGESGETNFRDCCRKNKRVDENRGFFRNLPLLDSRIFIDAGQVSTARPGIQLKNFFP